MFFYLPISLSFSLFHFPHLSSSSFFMKKKLLLKKNKRKTFVKEEKYEIKIKWTEKEEEEKTRAFFLKLKNCKGVFLFYFIFLLFLYKIVVMWRKKTNTSQERERGREGGRREEKGREWKPLWLTIRELNWIHHLSICLVQISLEWPTNIWIKHFSLSLSLSLKLREWESQQVFLALSIFPHFFAFILSCDFVSFLTFFLSFSFY